jgi:hypothetical protein
MIRENKKQKLLWNILKIKKNILLIITELAMLMRLKNFAAMK